MKLLRSLLICIVAVDGVEAGLKTIKESDRGIDFADEEEALTERNIRDLLHIIDLNDDGKASLDEFKQFAEHLQVASARQEYEEHQNDPESDNHHVPKTIQESLEDFKMRIQGENPEGDEATLKNEKEKLEAADENKDGKIDKDEYFNYQHGITDRLVETEARHRMQEVDTNSDGFIELREFERYHFGQPLDDLKGDAEANHDGQEEAEDTGEKYVKERHREFAMLDKDGNGLIDLSEWKPYHSLHYFDQLQSAILIEHADSDKDGYLTADELINAGLIGHSKTDTDHLDGARYALRTWHEKLNKLDEL